jgi:uncharacterized protein (DUF983 family)
MNILSILQGKCPRCHKAHVFKTFWRIHTHCAACGTRFEREAGYYVMAIFTGYFLAGAAALPGILFALYFRWSFLLTVAVPIVCILLAAPWIFHYSRIIWLHVDQRLDPRID